MTCPLCRAEGPRPSFTKNGHAVWLCRSCENEFVHPRPADISGYYSIDYFRGNREKFGYTDYAAEAAFQRRNFRRRAARLSALLPEGGRALDVGCATGDFLAELGPRWEKRGVEVSAELLKEHPAPPEVRVFVGEFEDFPVSEGPFDAVTLFDVLDHVLDPKAVLAKAAGLLRPGGVLAVLQGDRSSLFARLLGRRWYIYIPPTHLWFFSRRGLSRLLEEHGLAPELVEYEPRFASVELCLFRLSYIAPLFGLVERLYRAVRGTALGRLGVRFNFRDVMTVYARKR